MINMLTERCINNLLAFLCLGVILIGVGCAASPQPHRLDSPEYRVESGFKLLKLNRIQDAKRELKKALNSDPCYSKALRGLALAYALEKNFKQAEIVMGKALSCATTPEESALAHVGFVRIYTMKNGHQWLKRVDLHFKKAIDSSERLPEAYYYLGVAYRKALKLSKAEWAFKRVLQQASRMVAEAEDAVAQLQKIREAMPTTNLGKEIAIQPNITRAEVAVLLIDEFKLDRIFVKLGILPKNFFFKSIKPPSDIIDHPYKEQILKVLKLQLGGMEINKQGYFNPEEMVTRAQYAIIISGVIKRIKGSEISPVAYKKIKSPFTDVKNEDPYFEAVMLCTKWRNIIEFKGREFNPMNLISGVDAVLAIRRLKDELRIYND